jgi:hypothetical protein
MIVFVLPKFLEGVDSFGTKEKASLEKEAFTLTIAFRGSPLPEFVAPLIEYAEPPLQIGFPGGIADLFGKAEQIERHIDLVERDIHRVLVLVIDAVLEQVVVFLVHVIHEIDFGSAVPVGVFGQNFILVLNQMMDFDPVAYRTKQDRNVMNMSAEMLQRPARADHTCAAAKAHARLPPYPQLPDSETE